jgi:drug/metabolite transporter (DMT)-like permease
VFSLPFFLIVGFWSQRGAPKPLEKRDWWAVIGLGLLGYYFSSYMDFLGLQYIPASLERLILYLYPTFTLLLSAFLFKKAVTRRMLIALAVSYAGIALVVGHDVGVAQGSAIWIGIALVAVSAFTYALYLVLSTEVIARIGAARFTAWAMTVSSLACIVQFLLTHSIDGLRLPAKIYGLSIILAVFATVLPTFMMSAALKRIGANNVSLIGAIGPVATIALGALMLGEAVNLWQIAGAALVISGVIMISLKK